MNLPFIKIIGALTQAFCHYLLHKPKQTEKHMKAIKTRPSQRPLLVVLSMTILTGCSGIQPKAVYKDIEQTVQHAYNAAAPIHKEGLVPALFKTVSMPGMNALNRPQIFKARHLPQAPALEEKPLTAAKSPKKASALPKPVVKQDKAVSVKPEKYTKHEAHSTPIKNLHYIEKYYGL